MKRREISREVVPELVEDLRDIPDGTRITIGELIADSFYADDVFTDEDMAFLMKKLYSAAKRENITLDRQSDCSYIVHNKDAKYICPHCGSKNTARILYGLPAFSPQMEKKLNEGRLYLGGCCIMGNDPDRLCNDCEMEFSTTSDWFNIMKEISNDEPEKVEMGNVMPENIEQVESLTFLYGTFGQKTTRIQINHTDNGAEVIRTTGDYFTFSNGCSTVNHISKASWSDLIDKLYHEFRFHEWELVYSDDKTLDGFEWKMIVQFPDNHNQERRGYNAYPPCWNDLMSYIRTLL